MRPPSAFAAALSALTTLRVNGIGRSRHPCACASPHDHRGRQPRPQCAVAATRRARPRRRTHRRVRRRRGARRPRTAALRSGRQREIRRLLAFSLGLGRRARDNAVGRSICARQPRRRAQPTPPGRAEEMTGRRQRVRPSRRPLEPGSARAAGFQPLPAVPTLLHHRRDIRRSGSRPICP